MEIEIVVLSPRIRFKKICYNYVIKIIQMNLMYLIIERVPEDFLLFIGKAEFDSVKFLKWNNLIHPETDNENERIQISDLELNFSNDKIHRRKKRKKRKKKKKLFPSQLIRLIVKLRRIDLELAKLEKVDFSWNKSWKKNFDSMINIEKAIDFAYEKTDIWIREI